MSSQGHIARIESACWMRTLRPEALRSHVLKLDAILLTLLHARMRKT